MGISQAEHHSSISIIAYTVKTVICKIFFIGNLFFRNIPLIYYYYCCVYVFIIYPPYFILTLSAVNLSMGHFDRHIIYGHILHDRIKKQGAMIIY